MDEEEDSKHVHNLMDENSSLRSLNMSLIYEREKLLRELRQCDSEMVSMQRAVDGLLQSGSSAGKPESNGALCQVGVLCFFFWLCSSAHADDAGPDVAELTAPFPRVCVVCVCVCVCVLASFGCQRE
jgi:hypothetical protein